MNGEWAQVSLDFGRFYKEAKSWNVPILGVRGIDAGDLYINGKLVDNNQYDIEGSDIQFKNSLLPEKIDKNTQGYIKINFNAKKLISSRYWLGLIISIIGMIGSIAQPILHYLDLLYVTPPPLVWNIKDWEYDTQHVFAVSMDLENLTDSYIDNWEAYLLVRNTQEVDVIAAKEGIYSFVGGPFPLKKDMEFAAATGPEVTEKVLQGGYVQGCIVLAKKELGLGDKIQLEDFQLKPADHSSRDLVILGTPKMGGLGN